MRSPFVFAFVFALSLAFAAFAPESRADGATAVPSPAAFVPLVVKAVDYDRHFAARANGHVHAVIVYRRHDALSEKAAREIARVLGNTAKIAGLLHDERVVPYTGPNALAADLRSKQASVVILSTGLGRDVPLLAHALDGIDVLSVALDPDDVTRGMVLGVDVRSGKPTMVIRVTQARRQNVAFEASLLALARIE